jgi:hypothetical protein
MSQAQASRDLRAVVAQIQADFTDYPLVVEIDNHSVVDQVTQQDPYLLVEVDFLPGGGQLDLAERPLVRQVGQLCLYAVVKKDSGTDAARRLLDFVVPYFELQTCGSVKLHAAQAIRAREVKGWWYVPTLLDFWYDRLAR